MIKAEDVASGKWTPRQAEMGEWALEYCQSLEEGGRFLHNIWPDHCLLGSAGLAAARKRPPGGHSHRPPGGLHGSRQTPTHPGAPPQQLGGLPLPQELASGRPRVDVFPASVARPGHAVTPALLPALNKWSELRERSITWVLKGQNNRTEMYSALKAEAPKACGSRGAPHGGGPPKHLGSFGRGRAEGGPRLGSAPPVKSFWRARAVGRRCLQAAGLPVQVPVDDDPATKLNMDLITTLGHHSQVVVCGEAKSHCVNYTLRDLVSGWPDERIADLVLLQDGCSPVPGFEESADKFESDMRAKGVTIVTSTDYAPN